MPKRTTDAPRRAFGLICIPIRMNCVTRDLRSSVSKIPNLRSYDWTSGIILAVWVGSGIVRAVDV